MYFIFCDLDIVVNVLYVVYVCELNILYLLLLMFYFWSLIKNNFEVKLSVFGCNEFLKIEMYVLYLWV